MIDEMAVTQVTDGARRLDAVEVGSHLVAREGMAPVASLRRRRSQCIVLEAEGYELRCLPSTVLRAPTQWVRADKADFLVMCGYPARLCAMGPALKLSDEAGEARASALIESEQAHQTGTVLRTRSAGTCAELQHLLLARGIRSHRRAARLVLHQPYAGAYAELGISGRPSVREHLRLGRSLGVVGLDPVTQRSIAQLLAKQKLEGMRSHAAELSELQSLGAMAIAGEMVVTDGVRMLHLLGRVPVPEVLQRNALVQLLRQQCLPEFAVRVTSRRRCERTNMVEVVGADHLADGFLVHGGKA